MAKTRRQAQVYADLLDRYGKQTADAFLAAVDRIKAAAEVQRLTAAIEAGQIEQALAALHIDAAAYNEMLDAIEAGYREAGQTATGFLPKRNASNTALTFLFDARNPVAEAWLRDHSSTLITRIVADQRDAVRVVLREGMEAGISPRSTALRIVGTLNRATGKREGGILGLSGPQEAYVRNARAELASGDPRALQAYLGRKQRNKVFDGTIKRAIADGKPVPAETVRKAAAAYESSLLRLRGETIGRTEALTSLNAAQYESARQAVESGQVTASQVRRVWRSASDPRVRDSHQGLNADSVGFGEAFTSPTGARLRFPGDSSLGAGAAETINCRCVVETRVDWFANLR